MFMTAVLFSFLGLSAFQWAIVLVIGYVVWFLYRYLTGKKTGIVRMFDSIGQYIYIFLVVGSMLVVCGLTYNAFYKSVYATSQSLFKTGEYAAEVVSYRLNQEVENDDSTYKVVVSYRNKQGDRVIDEVGIESSRKPVIGSTIAIDYSLSLNQWYLFLVRGTAILVSALCIVSIAVLVLLGLGSLLFKGSLSPIEAFSSKVLKKVVSASLLMAAIMIFVGGLIEHGYLIVTYILYCIFFFLSTLFYKAYQMATTQTVSSPYDRKKKGKKKKR